MKFLVGIVLITLLLTTSACHTNWETFVLTVVNILWLCWFCNYFFRISSAAYETLKSLGLPADSVALLKKLSKNTCEQCIKEILHTTLESKSPSRLNLSRNALFRGVASWSQWNNVLIFLCWKDTFLKFWY